MRERIVLIMLVLMICSCGQSGRDGAISEMAAVDLEAVSKTRSSVVNPSAPDGEINQQKIDKKKIIRDGRMGMKVPDLEKAKQNTDILVKANGGYYAGESLSNTDYESSYHLKIRIPAGHFDQFITGLEGGENEVTFKEIDARDVTDQFIDLETRLENKKEYLLRYRELLNRAGTIKEILEIEEKIRVLEEEIESTTGRLKYLADLVDFSSLDLTITQKKDFIFKSAQRSAFFERLKQSVSNGWYGFVDFFLFLVKLWPLLIIAATFCYFWRKFKRKKRAHS